jgi:shikimate dehydrogenase
MRLFGLIGFPLSHSFSEKYFEKKFARDTITDASYKLFPLEDISLLPELIEQYTDLEGLNITIPHKIQAMPFMQHIDKEAVETGAINCVKIHRDGAGIKLSGFNTDIYGFRQSLLPVLKPHHQHALVLGTGGASRAVWYVLDKLGIHYKCVSHTKKEAGILRYWQLTKEIIETNTLIINSTPLGMFPETNAFPDIPYQFINKEHLLFDLIYNPDETKFLKKGKEAGATIKNGMEMLELQAEKSWEIWNER